MEAKELEVKLMQSLRAMSGLEKHRPYLGMSGISKCSRRLYQEFTQGRLPPRDRDYYYCWSGYLFERAILDLLGAKRQEVEVIASWDSRFQGHIDYVLSEQAGVLLEIKSITFEKFLRLQESGRPDEANVAQVQMYMRHG